MNGKGVPRSTRRTTPASDVAWVIAFRVVLALLALGTLKAIATIVWARAEFLSAFPAAQRIGVAGPLVVAIVGLLGALAGMTLRRAGITLLLFSCALTLALDAWLRAPASHLVVASVASASVLVFIWQLRDRIH